MNKIKEMIKNVFNNNEILTARELIIFFVISFVLTISDITFCYDNIRRMMHYDDRYEFILFSLIFYTLLYLPQIIVFLVDYLIKKFKITNKILIKVIYVLISMFSCAYFLFGGWIIYFELFEPSYWQN